MIADWINLSQTAGTSGITTVTVTASSYSELLERSASLTVRAGEKSAVVTVQQVRNENFNVSPTSFEVGPELTYCYIIINSDLPWACTSAPDWCAFSPVSASSGQQIAMVVTGNTGSSDRSGIVTFTQSGTNVQRSVSVVQRCRNYNITISPASHTFPSSGSSQQVTITSDYPWTLTYPEWINVSASSGSGNATIYIETTGVNTGSTLNGSIVASTEYSTSATMSVSQTGGYIMPSVIFSSSTMYFPSSGSNQQNTIQATVDWEARPADGWVGLNPVNGSANSVVTVTVGTFQNLFDDRTGHINIYILNTNILIGTITIEQEGAEVVYDGDYLTGGETSKYYGSVRTGVYAFGYVDFDRPEDEYFDFARSRPSSLEMRVRYKGTGKSNDVFYFGNLWSNADFYNNVDVRVVDTGFDVGIGFPYTHALSHPINEYGKQYDLTLGMSGMTIIPYYGFGNTHVNNTGSISFGATFWLYDNANHEYVVEPFRDGFTSYNVRQMPLELAIDPTTLLIRDVQITKDGVLGFDAFAGSYGDVDDFDLHPISRAGLINRYYNEYGGKQVCINDVYHYNLSLTDGDLPFVADEFSLSFSANGETVILKVRSDENWSTDTNADWITYSPSGGSAGETEITIVAEPNTGIDPKYGYLDFIEDGVTVWDIDLYQDTPRPELFLSDDLYFPLSGDTKQLTINTNGNWEITDISNWLTASETAGTYGITTVNITATSGETREGWISVVTTINGRTASKWINVYQQEPTCSIIYRSDDGNIINPEGRVLTNVYQNGYGVIELADEMFDFDNVPRKTHLTSIDLSDFNHSIPENAFWGCSSLTSVVLSSATTVINRRAFYGCESLVYINLENVRQIKEAAFIYCTSLSSLTLTDMNAIDEYAFSSCTALRTVSISATTGTPASYLRSYAFALCSSLEEVNIDCVNLRLNERSSCLFQGCDSLSSVTISQQTPPAIMTDTFYGIATGGTLYTRYDYSSWLSSNPYYLGYYGWTSQGSPSPSPEELYYHVYSSTTFMLYNLSAATSSFNLEYKVNDGVWNSITLSPGSSTNFAVQAGDYVYLRGNNTTCRYFRAGPFAGNWEVGGNIMSLLDKNNFSTLRSFSTDRVFYGFFGGVTNQSGLISAQNLILPATGLTDYCYYNMFGYCSNLTSAPELPALTVPSHAYDSMFYNCTHLNSIKCLATSLSNAPTNWVKNVSSSGTFYKNANMSSWTTGDNGIPSGWTVEDV